MTDTFQQLGLITGLTEILKKQGITTPTKVQQQTIPPLLKGRDILCRAQTGTGKTLAFLLPILQQIQVTQSQEQVLILAPTRELANQITSVATTLGAPLHIDVLNLIGGKTIENQLQKLHRHPHLIIGTPGRLLDHCTRRALHLSGIRRIIVDEADQMLQQGFLEEVDTLIGMTSKRRQLLFFSATIPDKIKGLAKKHMNAPLVLSIQEGDTITLEQIEQRIYMIREEKKLSLLCQQIREMSPYLAVVFCNTRERTSILAGQLIQAGFLVSELRGDMSQGRRTQVLKDFAKAKTQLLVTTDIAARGIDIEGITHVFNYDVPRDVDYYIHRIGRTGRAGQTGLSIMYATTKDEMTVRRIEQHIQATITKYTATGQVKVKKSHQTWKKKKNPRPTLPPSTYQTTKSKRHKTLHKGSDNRRRR
ncbi:DEAD/DEAH box helicase [uncultured Megasphaera sp.]|uniref:DEAD/DEAH box helicase n=1 Tax=uncultured Megasphaera sp. TaxID=165188 RepID=UPI0025999566|nr:DEAD/DEAH box helicase [uncultured Megasphaera sp.]